MRRLFPLLTVSTVLIVALGCQSSEDASTPQGTSAAASTENRIVEVGCAGCLFNMEGAEGCQLAVKIDGKTYLVSGADIDTHEAGLCDSAKQAVVEGEVEAEKFVATKFELQ